MKYAKIVDGVVEVISYPPAPGYVEVDDNVFGGMVLQEDGSYDYTEEFKADRTIGYDKIRQRLYPDWHTFAEAYTEKEIGGDSTKWNEYVTKYNKVRTDNPKE